LIFLKV